MRSLIQAMKAGTGSKTLVEFASIMNNEEVAPGFEFYRSGV